MTDFFQRSASFFDPFAEINVVGPSEIFPDAKQLSGLHVDAPPPYSEVKSLKVVSAETPRLPNDSSDGSSLIYNASTKLSIHGQGTVVANCVSPRHLLFTFSTDDASKPSIYIEVTTNTINFSYGPTPPAGSTGFLPPDRVAIPGAVKNLSAQAHSVSTYLHTHNFPARYWLSVDHKNGILLFGRDLTNLSLALYEAKLRSLDTTGVPRWIDEKYAFIDNLASVSVQQQGGNVKDPMPLQLVRQPLPIVMKATPFIVPSDTITLDELASGSVMVPANLSSECQRLYANISGPNIALDTEKFPDFTKAIERSVNTEGLLCQKLLQKKMKKNYNTTYLRITLGADLGNSPGAPYVLEIWPAMHSSPIHDHGKTHAVIKVLHGKIKAYYFSSLHEPQQIGPPANLEKDDITWIDPNNYQIHQLSNESQDGSICCTIQCYAYAKGDKRHYEKFDYINEDKHFVDGFEPNSDMRFDQFKQAIWEEWEAGKGK